MADDSSTPVATVVVPLRHLHSPCSSVWDTQPLYGAAAPALDALRVDVYFGGKGFIAGTVMRKGDPSNLPLERQVLLYSEGTRLLVGSTWSDKAGDYAFRQVNLNDRYTVIAYDHRHAYRAVIADNLAAERMP
ncbi:hypothetical protein [Xylophilus ampelinus]|uniref:Carboxypeptidase family protein n=1 Tax=Xylophilus ampelinus TaxID=54067 RepID=A0A318SQN7_9BURK|nr:hypothetical protein [Xylophilus ampelinus]MCS4509130.1 hypothetical protein [Xylophilus ampelinus]PYE79842.1 hypothetical protein DFQ15_101162 [Xylophilus ampelinus]